MANREKRAQPQHAAREPADSLRDKSNVIGGWLLTLTFAFGSKTRIKTL